MKEPGMKREIIGEGRGREYKWSSDHIFVKTASYLTGGRVTVVEDTLKPGFHLPRHYHKQMTEIFYILSGEVVFSFDDETAVAGPGTTVNIPPHVAHDVTSDAGAKLLTIFIPGGFDDYLAEMASLSGEQLADDILMKDLAEKYDSWT
jgi:quercetin dioxygenase-like cupin family protein